MARKQHYGRDLWNQMCDYVQGPDGLPDYSCGIWTIEKLFFLCQYLAQTTQAMYNNPKFNSLNYVDLFCGPGVCCVNNNGSVRRYPGSVVLAAGCIKPFTNIYLVEKDPARLNAAKERIAKINKVSKVHGWNDDANKIVDEVASAIPERSLTVAFVDPYSLNIHFETIRKLARARPLDLLILFADRMDLERNVQATYYPQPNGKLDLFLGPSSNWRTKWDQLVNRDNGRIRQMFAELYLEQLAALGYQHAKTRIINGDHGPLYRLVYASKHELGLKFWKIAESEDLGGERKLWPEM